MQTTETQESTLRYKELFACLIPHPPHCHRQWTTGISGCRCFQRGRSELPGGSREHTWRQDVPRWQFLTKQTQRFSVVTRSHFPILTSIYKKVLSVDMLRFGVRRYDIPLIIMTPQVVVISAFCPSSSLTLGEKKKKVNRPLLSAPMRTENSNEWRKERGI